MKEAPETFYSVWVFEIDHGDKQCRSANYVENLLDVALSRAFANATYLAQQTRRARIIIEQMCSACKGTGKVKRSTKTGKCKVCKGHPVFDNLSFDVRIDERV